MKADLTIPPAQKRTDWGDCDLPSVSSTHVERDSITKRYPRPSLSVSNYPLQQRISLFFSLFVRAGFFPVHVRPTIPCRDIFELKFTLIAPRFTFGCLTFIFHLLPRFLLFRFPLVSFVRGISFNFSHCLVAGSRFRESAVSRVFLTKLQCT